MGDDGFNKVIRKKIGVCAFVQNYNEDLLNLFTILFRFLGLSKRDVNTSLALLFGGPQNPS